jgi:hypothetical protein
MAAEADWLEDKKKLPGRKNEKTVLTLTGLLMEGLMR